MSVTSSSSSIAEQRPNSSSSIPAWRRLFNKSSSSSSSTAAGKQREAAPGTQPNGITGAAGPSETHAHTDDDAQDTTNNEKHRQGIAPPVNGASADTPGTEEGETDDLSSSPEASRADDTARPTQSRRASSAGIQAGGVAFADNDDVIEGDEPTIDETPAPVEFLHKGAPYFWLSNHFQIPIIYDNVRYPSAEHLFQSLKFPNRPEIAKAVRKAETPSDAVRLARKNAQYVRDGWRKDGLNIVAMREVLLLKFTQHSALRSRLIQTGDRELLNSSPTDVFWGTGRAIGASKPAVGRNELGKALMRTREVLLNSAGLGWGSGAKTV